MSHIQRTLILFKPDAVQRGVVGEILTRFERVGLKIIGTKMIAPDKEQLLQTLRRNRSGDYTPR